MIPDRTYGMILTRELEKMEAERLSTIAEFRVAFGRHGFDVRRHSDELISSAVRRSNGTWSKPFLHQAFDLLNTAVAHTRRSHPKAPLSTRRKSDSRYPVSDSGS
jgi:hypothetical protein